MRARSLPPLPPVLALVFVLLVALPVASAAQSGLPATISMYPTVAGPGDTVEVTGLDFPARMTVVLALTTPASKSTLATVVSGWDGSFRELVTFPTSAREGAWTLSARSADGRAAHSYTFTSGDASTVPPAVVPDVAAETTPVPGETTTDKLVLVLIALVLGVLATAALYAYRLVQDDRGQPGMGTGDDLIWSGSTSAPTSEGPEGSEVTAADEPHWKQAAVSESNADEKEPASSPAAAQEAATSA